MFVALEKQAGAVCVGVFAAIIILGKMFGGSLWGLIPLGSCVTSGIWLWMKEVVRSGREVEWHSEKERGEHVSVSTRMAYWMLSFLGYCEPSSRIGRMDELYASGWMGPRKS